MKNTIVIIGKTSSGKSTVAQYISYKYNYYIIEIGNIVRMEYGRNKKSITLLEFANRYYLNNDFTIFIKKAVFEAEHCKNNKIIFTGIRTSEEFKYLLEHYPDLSVIEVLCDDINRASRYKKEHIDNVSIWEREIIEYEWLVSLLQNIKPDYYIYNNYDLDYLYNKIDDIFMH